MMTSPCPVYLFRSAGFAPSGNTVVSVAPLDCVVAVYGNGGVIGEGGLSSTFGGAAVFKNDASGDYFVGVWAARSFGLICGLRFTRKRQTRGFLSGERKKSALSLCANEGQPDFGCANASKPANDIIASSQ